MKSNSMPFIGLAALLVAQTADATWTTSTVVSTGTVGVHPSISHQYAIGNGKMRVVYEQISGTTHTVMYTSRYIDTGAFLVPVAIATGSFPSVYSDDIGNVFVSYVSPTNASARFATKVSSGGNCGSGGWNCQEVLQNVDTAETAAGSDELFFRDGSVKGAVSEGATFDVFGIPVDPLHSYDRLSLAYFDSGEHALALADGADVSYFQGDDSVYNLQPIGTASSTVAFTDIDIDSSDVVRVIFNNQFRKLNSGTWSGGSYTSNAISGRASLTTLGASNPAIIYGNSGGLHQAYSPGIGWTQYNIDTSVSVQDVDAVAVGTNTAIVYFDATNSDLKYAWGAH